ncbi:hypothetical protein [Streptococcus pneumoniae]|uniref:hypothetical protein n=1 Tax=Streptococcus pneumoniae TaxID=1313 RepID=UPI001156A7EE|nr:hypothetical protein [Streptococcus pneumoniae]
MKIKEQTRKLAKEASRRYHSSCFEVADRTDEVSYSSCFEVADRTDEVSLNAGCSKHCFEVKIELTKSAQSTADESHHSSCFEVVIELTKVSNHPTVGRR